VVPGKDHCWELVNIRVAVQLGRFIDQPIDCSERLFFMDFDVLLAVHLSIILVINQLNAQNLLYSKCIICLYVFRAPCIIIRSSKLFYTASGVITHLGGRPVHRLRDDFSHLLSTCARDGHLHVR